jgi:hypothetical protein
LVIEQVLRKTRVSRRNPRFSPFLSGCCSETSVSEQLYFMKNAGLMEIQKEPLK